MYLERKQFLCLYDNIAEDNMLYIGKLAFDYMYLWHWESGVQTAEKVAQTCNICMSSEHAEF